MIELRKRYGFEAAHFLTGLPDHHPCSRMHGHSYRLDLVLRGRRLDERGFLYDYRALDPAGAWIRETLDHRTLNDFIPQPTAERIGLHVAAELLGAGLVPLELLYAIRVSETQKTWAVVTLEHWA